MLCSTSQRFPEIFGLYRAVSERHNSTAVYFRFLWPRLFEWYQESRSLIFHSITWVVHVQGLFWVHWIETNGNQIRDYDFIRLYRMLIIASINFRGLALGNSAIIGWTMYYSDGRQIWHVYLNVFSFSSKIKILYRCRLYNWRVIKVSSSIPKTHIKRVREPENENQWPKSSTVWRNFLAKIA